VADGAGGHGSGDVASAAIIAALQVIPPGLSAAELLAQVRLRLGAVHAELQAEAARRGPGRRGPAPASRAAARAPGGAVGRRRGEAAACREQVRSWVLHAWNACDPRVQAAQRGTTGGLCKAACQQVGSALSADPAAPCMRRG
jgi:hypothetical protein